MTSLAQKVRTFTLGNLHELLDKVNDNPTALKQQIRDLESAMKQLENELVIQGGTVRTLNRDITTLKTKIDSRTTSIKSRMATTGPQDSVVRSWAAEVTGLQKELTQKETTDLPA